MNDLWSNRSVAIVQLLRVPAASQLSLVISPLQRALRLVVTIARHLSVALRSVVRRPRLFLSDVLVCAATYAVSVLCLFSVTSSAFIPSQFYAAGAPAAVFVLVCAVVFPATGLYMKNWRYASVPELLAIVRSILISSVAFAGLTLAFRASIYIPPTVIVVEAFILTAALAGTRLKARASERSSLSPALAKSVPERDLVPILLVGVGHAADLFLRALQRDANAQYWPVGILDPNPDEQGLLFKGVPVVGTLEQFDAVLQELDSRGQRPRHLTFTEDFASYRDKGAGRLIERAESLGIAVSRLPSPTELRKATRESEIELRRIELSDLLERPQAALDRDLIRRFVSGRRVLITGAGGSIGGELTKQIASLGPSDLVLIDHSEYNLYAIDLELSERSFSFARHSYLCNIREAARVNEIFDRHRPEIVFHVAALKHVPMVELNPCEGVLTNIVGSRNVADATQRIGALAMVQVSTDKVVNPTSFMGVTKRIAELYCQALDLENGRAGCRTRFMTVRFGNVLGSSGSLIPLFQRQLARGGPLTVTHPEMTRYFMTIREAVELTLHASAHGLESQIGKGQIFVLDMGKPIKVIDVARRMIRLAGYRPDSDIEIKIIGLRPGEKMYEELFDLDEQRVNSPVTGVFGAVPRPVALPVLQDVVSRLSDNAVRGKDAEVIQLVRELIPKYAAPQSDASYPVGREHIQASLSR